MKNIIIILCLLFSFYLTGFCEGSDTSNSETVENGKKKNLFFVDPKRLEKANEINFNAFEKKIELTPNPLSLKEISGINPSFKIVFTLKNLAKSAYLLSFPTAQRYEIVVKNSKGESLYNWSDDKEFVKTAGAILVNPDDKLTFTEILPIEDFSKRLELQSYVVEIKLSGYPELKASTSLKVTP